MAIARLIKKYTKSQDQKNLQNILNCKKDMKFIYVCINCRQVKMIISEEYHFLKNRDKLLKKGIRLLDLCEGLELSEQQN